MKIYYFFFANGSLPDNLAKNNGSGHSMYGIDLNVRESRRVFKDGFS